MNQETELTERIAHLNVLIELTTRDYRAELDEKYKQLDQLRADNSKWVVSVKGRVIAVVNSKAEAKALAEKQITYDSTQEGIHHITYFSDVYHAINSIAWCYSEYSASHK